MDKTRREERRDEEVEAAFLEGLNRRRPDQVRVLKPLADLYTRVGRLEEGLELDLKLSRLCPEEAGVWYNLACSYALTGRKDEAFSALEQAIALGYADRKWMLEDEDLAALRDDPRFDRLLARRVEGD